MFLKQFATTSLDLKIKYREHKRAILSPLPPGIASHPSDAIGQKDQTLLREWSLIIEGGGPVNLGGGPEFFGLPSREGHMFFSLR